MSRGYFPQQQSQRDRSTKRPERKCVICNVHTGLHHVLKMNGKPKEQNGEATAHTTHGEFVMTVHTETSMFARAALETGKALIDCGATRSMGSWEALDGLARMNEQRHGSTRLSLDRTKKTWYTFANGKRQQSEGEVASKVNAGGRRENCKMNCVNTTGVPIQLSVQSLSQMGAIIDLSTGVAFFRRLRDQHFVQLERETNGHLFLSLVEDLISQTISDKKSAARVPGSCAGSGRSRQFRKKNQLSCSIFTHPCHP